MVPLLSITAIKIKFIRHTFVKTVQSIISFLKMYKYSLLFLVAFIFSCTSEKKINEDVLKVSVDVEVDRFDETFANATPQDLENLKKEYPYLFPVQYPDSIWLEKMNDTLQIELEQEVAKVFSDFSEYEDEITLLFQHLKYYFPKFQEPKVLTLISDVDYRNSIVLADTLLLVGLDNYLGSDHFFYEGVPVYITKNLSPEQLTPSIAETFANQMVQPLQSRTFLDQMIHYGKIQYLKETLLPLFEPERILGYTKDEFNWARANEVEIWRYFVDREMLYSTDPQLAPRFLNPAPFSKFYLELDNESPGRLGQYIGWLIVKAYAKNNDASLAQVLSASGEEIFKNSKFKPQK